MKAVSLKVVLLGVAVILVGQGLTLWYFGQPFFCECGVVKVWEGDVASNGNSQQLADWYTFSHIIHGLLFFGLLSLFAKHVPLSYRLIIALGIEVAWEVFENTPWLINHYRQQALAAGYTGDSIFNSLWDSVAMIVGFVMAWRFPVWASVAFIIAAEVFVAYMIRDGLALNIINLIYPFEFIRVWQMGG
jgi:Protein of unknown function (DUF2585)